MEFHLWIKCFLPAYLSSRPRATSTGIIYFLYSSNCASSLHPEKAGLDE